MRLALLGSGSSGNVAYVESSARETDSPTRILIDAGLSPTAIQARLAALSGAPTVAAIDALFVTHEHSDHVGCAAQLQRPTFAPASTLNKKGLVGTRVLPGDRIPVGCLVVEAVQLLHDAAETVGYVVSDGIYRVGILTDCGEPEMSVARAYAGCDVLVLEANHDPKLLMDGPYPPSIQRRVRGRRGHLSNHQSSELLRMILDCGPPPQMLVAAHVSQKNNRADLVEAALLPLLGPETRFVIATSAGAPEVRLPLPLRRPRQLGLFTSLTVSWES